MAELDDVIHQPLRLRIMAALNALPSGVGIEFSKLKKLTGATDGNLGAHIETLSKAGYVAVDKAFVGKKPQTTVTATAAAPSPAMSRRCRRSSRLRGAAGKKHIIRPRHSRMRRLAQARNDGGG
jgi:DNA-binding transcriptional ArsR family regulator